MANVIPFRYEQTEVRVVQDESGEPWWVAKDVCQILGLDSTHKVVERLDDDEKGRKNIPTLGGIQELWVVNESGLYNLIIRSNKPEAKNFRRWVTHEVLPTIRKTGKFEMQGMSEIDLIIKSAHALKEIELKTNEHDQRLCLLEAKSDQNSGLIGYMTIVAWCNRFHLKLSRREAIQRGREASRLSRELGVEIGRVLDERFGMVNSYREDVLEEVFETRLADVG